MSARLDVLREEGLTTLPWGGDGRWMRGDEKEEDELILLTTKSPKRLHSQLEAADDAADDIVEGVPVAGVGCPAASDPDPEPVELHPEDAAARGLREGDLCVVRNDRSAVLARVKVNGESARGVALLRHGAWVRWAAADGEGEVPDLRGQANVLTSDVPTSDFARGNAVSGWRVRVAGYAAV